ncbi:Mdm33 family-domain-containing protein [Xylariaceae sp. FL0662B]|nr:Mdm33 family-domain-containing protein [Xylariaceae sp. FL0662B]
MAVPRAMKPFLGAGSRLLRDQLASQCTRICTAGTFISSRPTAAAAAAASASTCLKCRQNFALAGQSRSSSSSAQPPPPKSPRDESEKEAPTRDSAPNSSTSSPNPESTPDSTATPPPPPPQPPNPDLPSTQNSQRSQLNRSLSSFMDRAQTTLFTASQRLNDLTGYSGIERLKRQVSGVEAELASAQGSLHGARQAYKGAVSERSATQREVTTLLARQKTWSPADFERFTVLYRQDHELEARVADTARALEDAERDAERLSRDLAAGILARYHEEQIWSDKIRRMSTWGTWGLMGVNVLLFLAFQFGAEPWRRHRLVRGFEEKVREALEEERERDRVLREKWEMERAAETRAPAAAAAASVTVSDDVLGGEEAGAAGAAASTAEAEPEPATKPIDEPITEDSTVISWREALKNPDWWRAAFLDLSSERKIALRMRDVSIIALEGVIAGAALAGTMAVIIVRRA